MPLATRVRVAGTRWTVEETFQIAKGQVGLDQYQCRTWTSWHRFTALAMLALAILTIHHHSPDHPRRHADDRPDRSETRRLIAALLHRPPDIAHLIRWSYWRRRHQALARAGHYPRRELQQLSHNRNCRTCLGILVDSVLLRPDLTA